MLLVGPAAVPVSWSVSARAPSPLPRSPWTPVPAACSQPAPARARSCCSKPGLVGSDDSVYCCRTHPSLTVRRQSKGSSSQSRPLVLLDLCLVERYSPPCPQPPLGTRCPSTCPSRTPTPRLLLLGSAFVTPSLRRSSVLPVRFLNLSICCEVIFVVLSLHEVVEKGPPFTMRCISEGCT